MEDKKSYAEKEPTAQALLPKIEKNRAAGITEFFELFSDDIYSFPIKYFNFDDDGAGDFYLYAFEHLKDGRKLSSFKNQSKFTTWFFSVLRNLVIDFLRTQKNKLHTTTFIRTDSEGNVIDTMDAVPDNHELSEMEEDLIAEFNKSLEDLKISHRVLFKLAYAHYVNINEKELLWLEETNSKSKSEIIEIIFELKEIGLKKASQVRSIEEKLTANFQAISVLENKITKFFEENPNIEVNRQDWSDSFVSSDTPPEMIQQIQMLCKKKEKHLNLLSMQKKSLLSTRIPFKNLVTLLGSSPGVLSVQLIRILEKLENNMQFN